MNIDELVTRMRRALATLDEQQGRVSRRNARDRVRSAMRAIDRALEAEYPAIRKEIVRRRKKRKTADRLRDMQRRGYTRVTDAQTVGYCAEHGVRVILVQGAGVWVPQWALTILQHGHLSKLGAAARSPKIRKALLVELALTGAP